MKLFNNHNGSRGLPHFNKRTYWATALFLRTPFTEGCAGANKKPSPPGRQQEQASKQRCTFSHTTFSSVQFRPRSLGSHGLAEFALQPLLHHSPYLAQPVHGRAPKHSAVHSVVVCMLDYPWFEHNGHCCAEERLGDVATNGRLVILGVNICDTRQRVGR